ncbi:MAG: hypothetical protein K5989_09395 [Lachnospiraceae bacterium]|nr:hypothetical protein [Lachnospiraceae bacterium]
MKKLVCITLTLSMMLSLSACGGKTETQSAGGKTDGSVAAATETAGSGEAAVTEEGAQADDGAAGGQVYDTGNFKVLEAEGWKVFPQKDMFSEDKDALNPNMVQICKGGKTETDIFTYPSMTISYGGKDNKLVAPSKEFYDNVEDLDDIVTGTHTWTAFKCESVGTKMYVLYEDTGDIQYQASLCYEMSGGNANIDDADVQAILTSIESTEK